MAAERATRLTTTSLLDRLEIRDLLYRYARGVDRRDVDMVGACFTPDCRYDGALASGTVADMLAALPAAMARYERTMHFMGEPAVDLDGDTAHSETPTVAYHLVPEGGGMRVVHVVYRDSLRRTHAGWRIVERNVRRAVD